MGNNSGTIVKLVIDGVSYDVPADVAPTFNRSSFTIEGLPTSGKTMMKYTRRIPTIDGLTISANPSEHEALNAGSESLATKTFAITLADGSTYRTTGQYNYESWETESNNATIQIIPDKTKNAWTPFLA